MLSLLADIECGAKVIAKGFDFPPERQSDSAIARIAHKSFSIQGVKVVRLKNIASVDTKKARGDAPCRFSRTRHASHGRQRTGCFQMKMWY